MAYATLAELRGFVGIPAADTADDSTLQIALDAASAQVDGYTGRTFNLDSGVSARYYTATDANSVTVDQLQTTVGLIVATDEARTGAYATTWTLDTDYYLAPTNAPSAGAPWTRLLTTISGTKRFPLADRAVKVTARWGWTSVPAGVKQATLLQSSRLWLRKNAPFGVAGSPDLGSEVRLLAKLDPDVEALLRPYRRQWVVVT